MDINKLKTLRELGYSLRKCCGLCKHSDKFITNWSRCSKNVYKHQKHTDTNRFLSINIFGYCGKFEWINPDGCIENWEEFKER